MNSFERRNKIVDMVNTQGSVLVLDLSNLFGISEVTIRADLRLLEEKGLLGSRAWVATPEQPMFSSVGTPDVDIRWNSHAVVGTYGFELLEGLPHPRNYDFFVWKGMEPDMHPYGACYHTLDWKANPKSTGVIEYLKVQGIRTVIVGGLATDYCVKNTALQLADAGFNVVLNLASSRGIAPDTIAAALDDMRAAGITIVDNVNA